MVVKGAPDVDGLAQNGSNTRGPVDQHGLTSIHYKVWDVITYPFPNFSGAAIEVWEWISNVFLHVTGHVVTYPCWDLSKSMLVKGAPVR